MIREKSIDSAIMRCQVRTVRATINSSVKISDVNVMDTTWMNSDSNRRRAPYIMVPSVKRE